MIKVIPHDEYLEKLPSTLVITVPYTKGSKLRLPDNIIKKCRYCKHLVEIRPYNANAKAFVCLNCAGKHNLCADKLPKRKKRQ